MTKLRSIATILFLTLLLGIAPVFPTQGFAQQSTSQEPAAELTPRAKLEASRLELEQIQASIQRPSLNEATLVSIRERLMAITLDAREIADRTAPQAETIRNHLKELGPKPDDKSAPESLDVTRERDERERALKDADETVRLARIIAMQAEQLGSTVADRRRAMFARELFHRNSSLLNPALWATVLTNLPSDGRAFVSMLSDTWDRIRDDLGWTGLGLILAVFFAAFSVRPLSLRLAARIGERYKSGPEPTDLLKAVRGIIITVASVVLPGAAAFLVFQITAAVGVVPPRVEPVIVGILKGFVFVTFITGLAYGLFAPNVPRMRLFLIPNDTAERLVRLAITTALLLVLGRVIEAINQAIAAALPLSVVTQGVFAVLIALNIMRELRELKPFDECDEAAFGQYVNTSTPWVTAVRAALWIALTSVVLAAVLGFISLATFIVDQIAWAAIIAAGFTLTLRFVHGGFERLTAPDTRAQRALQNAVGIPRTTLMQLGVLTVGILQLLLGGLAILLLLAPWGVESTDLLYSVRAALFGFTIGDITISFATIFAALMLFAGGIILTRTIQRWLRTRYLPQTQLDSGLKNSITTGLGYVGIVAACYFSLASLGLSLDRLAIVAGALSVGIGFGLQSIVNNFVSGLILLWERSIRVGDLVVIGSDQGYVRRINVRSTEIETFDRATVIVPNSNLVSGVVKNRVHTDRIGRVLVTIPMQRDIDPDLLADVMREAAESHEEVLEDPAPRVLFRKAGDAMLEFDLIGFVAEVETANRISSDLTFAIWRQIRARNMLPAPPPPPVIRLEASVLRGGSNEADPEPEAVEEPQTKDGAGA